jgi:hypothetical protein
MLKGAPKGAKGRVQRALSKDTTKGGTTKGRQKLLGALCSYRKGAKKERQERAPRKSAKKERKERASRKSVKKERQERAPGRASCKCGKFSRPLMAQCYKTFCVRNLQMLVIS